MLQLIVIFLPKFPKKAAKASPLTSSMEHFVHRLYAKDAPVLDYSP